MRIAALILGLLLASTAIRGQDYTGLHSGNWIGVNSLHINPANVVDNRFKVDINLLSIHAAVSNDYIGVNWTSFFNPSLFDSPDFNFTPGLFNASDFDRQHISRDSLSPFKNLTGSVRIQMPSFMFQITPRDAIGISVNARMVGNIDKMSNDLAELMYNGLQTENLNLTFDGSFSTMNTLSWTEIGISYGRVIIDQDQHFLKVGITPKMLLGSAAGYATIRDFRFRFNDVDTIEYLQGDVYYGHSSNLNPGADGMFNPFKFEGFGMGLDIGAVYEWRPRFMRYRYNMDGKKNLWRKDQEKYMLRIGMALTDLGYLRFTKDKGSRNYHADVHNLPLSFFEGIETLHDFSEKLDEMPGMTATSTENENFVVSTPLTLITTVDWQITEGIYLNITPILAFNKSSKLDARVHGQNSLTITPRLEFRWFGLYMPVGFRELTGFNWGISMRVGPLFFGSGSFLSNLVQEFPRGADFHFGLKIPIPHGKPKDRDRDEVSDRRDRCINVPGLWEFGGCPDSDRDGIEDSKDECPHEAGPEKFRGCPDTDGDGIPDKDDRCPADFGIPELNGCPDADGDGIPDHEDDCPDEKGLLKFNGCPDTDGDGIPDKLDRCPNHPGPESSYGCPDTDGDGIYDDRDKCPDVPGLPELDGCPFSDSDNDGIRDLDDKCPDLPGPIENHGCPYADTDEDGIIDIEDHCPNTPGPRENNGCPEITREDREVLKHAFNNLEFETGKAVISASSFESLDKLAALLLEKPQYFLLIEGHTDNVGSRESNLILSRNRAEAVKKYLMKKGVTEDRILTKYYGPDKPVADNNTEEGRQQNRRVEMTVIFK